MPAQHASAQDLWVCDLRTVRYLDALAMQERVRAARQQHELPDTLLLLEHPPVYTLGRRANAAELALTRDFYRAKGIELHSSDRGGRITYHGPGQLVGYPIVHIDDVHAYVRALECAIVAALACEAVHARARPQDGPDYTGVWVAQRKIASIGVHVQRNVTTHGFAVNVCNDLQPFSWIVACGLPGVSMTSLEHELHGHASMPRFRAHVVRSFCETFALRPTHVTPAQLGLATTPTSSTALGDGAAHGSRTPPGDCAARAAQASASEPSLQTSAIAV